MRIDMCIDMSVDVYIDMRIDISVDMCMDMCIEMYRGVNRHVYKHVYKHVRVWALNKHRRPMDMVYGTLCRQVHGQVCTHLASPNISSCIILVFLLHAP